MIDKKTSDAKDKSDVDVVKATTGLSASITLSDHTNKTNSETSAKESAVKTDSSNTQKNSKQRK